MGDEIIISANNLSAGYGKSLVWGKADFSIAKGQFVAVLGPNGAGKTTLFRLLLGLNKPLGGELLLFGQNPSRGNPKIGYVPQRHLIDEEVGIEALEIVRLGLSAHRWGIGSPSEVKRERQEALAALESVGAGNLAHRRLGRLSGGELQRIFLAQALVGNPELLLLDEPLANLDIRRELEMVSLIKDIVLKRGVTVLLIAHNINPLLSALDLVVYMANGRVASGNPKEVLNSQKLTSLYGAPIEVLRDSLGRLAIVGVEEGAHHE